MYHARWYRHGCIHLTQPRAPMTQLQNQCCVYLLRFSRWLARSWRVLQDIGSVRYSQAITLRGAVPTLFSCMAPWLRFSRWLARSRRALQVVSSARYFQAIALRDAAPSLFSCMTPLLRFSRWLARSRRVLQPVSGARYMQATSFVAQRVKVYSASAKRAVV